MYIIFENNNKNNILVGRLNLTNNLVNLLNTKYPNCIINLLTN